MIDENVVGCKEWCCVAGAVVDCWRYLSKIREHSPVSADENPIDQCPEVEVLVRLGSQTVEHGTQDSIEIVNLAYLRLCSIDGTIGKKS